MSSEEQNRSREAIEAELSALRNRIQTLEQHLNRISATCRQSDRKEISVDIEFIGDFDVVCARGVNLSDDGICFDVFESLPFEMAFEHDGAHLRLRAFLAWMKHLPDGRQRFGFSFNGNAADTAF